MNPAAIQEVQYNRHLASLRRRAWTVGPPSGLQPTGYCSKLNWSSSFVEHSAETKNGVRWALKTWHRPRVQQLVGAKFWQSQETLENNRLLLLVIILQCWVPTRVLRPDCGCKFFYLRYRRSCSLNILFTWPSINEIANSSAIVAARFLLQALAVVKPVRTHWLYTLQQAISTDKTFLLRRCHLCPITDLILGLEEVLQLVHWDHLRATRFCDYELPQFFLRQNSNIYYKCSMPSWVTLRTGGLWNQTDLQACYATLQALTDAKNQSSHGKEWAGKYGILDWNAVNQLQYSSPIVQVLCRAAPCGKCAPKLAKLALSAFYGGCSALPSMPSRTRGCVHQATAQLPMQRSGANSRNKPTNPS